MTRTLIIGNANPLQFGSWIQVQLATQVDGITISNQYVTFDANKFACVYDTQNTNIVVFHFGDVMYSVSNGEYNTFFFSVIQKTDSVDLAQAVILDIASLTT